ncbi:hypothetical protein D3C81_1637920 [compost metagenome]
MARIVLGNRHPPQLGMLHHIVAGDKMDHLSIEPPGQLRDQLILPVRIAAVADQPAQPDTSAVGIFQNAPGNIIGCIHGHHFTGADNIDFLCLVLPDRHGEPAANHIAEHVV